MKKPRRCPVCNHKLANHPRKAMHAHCAAVQAIGRFGEPELMTINWDAGRAGDIKKHLDELRDKIISSCGIPKEFYYTLDEPKGYP